MLRKDDTDVVDHVVVGAKVQLETVNEELELRVLGQRGSDFMPQLCNQGSLEVQHGHANPTNLPDNAIDRRVE